MLYFIHRKVKTRRIVKFRNNISSFDSLTRDIIISQNTLYWWQVNIPHWKRLKRNSNFWLQTSSLEKKVSFPMSCRHNKNHRSKAQSDFVISITFRSLISYSQRIEDVTSKFFNNFPIIIKIPSSRYKNNRLRKKSFEIRKGKSERFYSLTLTRGSNLSNNY